MHLDKNSPAILHAPSHVPADKQAILHVEEQFFHRTLRWRALDNIHVTPIYPRPAFQLHTLERTPDLAGTENFGIALQTCDLLWAVVSEGSARRLHPTVFPIESFLEFPDVREFDHR